MSQEEIINFLKKVKRPVDMKDLLVAFPHKGRAVLSKNCTRMRKYKDIKFEKVQEGRYLKYIYYL